LNLFDRSWAGDQLPEWIEVLARWTELPPEAVSPRYLLSDIPSAAQLLRLDVPTLIEDVVNDARLDDNTRTFYLERFDGKSMLFAPLVVGGQWIGYISAIYREPTTFLDAEVRRLTSLSGQAAVVVQGLRQLHEIQARARREVLIREITGKIRASTDLETILKTTVSEVSGALGTSHGAIRLGTPERVEEGNSRELSQLSSSELAASSTVKDGAQERQEPNNPATASPQQSQQGSASPSQVGKGGQE
jgi:GAF domain-containing protein